MNCVILFNCHGCEIKKQLQGSSNFTQKYHNIYLIALYDYLEGYQYADRTDLLPEHYLKISNTDLLIIQVMKRDHSFLNIKSIKKLMKEVCHIIQIPHYTFSGYFPKYEAYKDVNFDLSKSYQELQIYIENLPEFSDENIKNNLQTEFQHLKELDELSDIKMYDIIQENYYKSRLFHARGYPTGHFFYLMSQEILKICNLDFNFPETYSGSFVKKEIPIHPRVIQVLRLNFPYKSSKIIYNYNLVEYYVVCVMLNVEFLIFDQRETDQNGNILDTINILNQVIQSGKYR